MNVILSSLAALLLAFSPTAAANATKTAAAAAAELTVKGKAPKTGYERAKFSDGWGSAANGCDLRNVILKRDLRAIKTRADDPCIVEQGQLVDPYTATTISFRRGISTSSKVQIDHVVAVSDAWQKGAQSWSYEKRNRFYNDPLNLLAVSGSANAQKGDSDAASWLPSNKTFRCEYIARQVSIKRKYQVWVTTAEKAAMLRVLKSCPSQPLISR